MGNAPVSLLRNKFGIIGEKLKAMGLGICHREVKTKEESPKSIGHSMTLPKDVHERDEIHMYLLHLTEMVCKRARAYGYKGRCVSLTVRLPDFVTFTKQKVMPEYTNLTHRIYPHVISILNSIRLNKGVRLFGVSISNLTKDEDTPNLFKEIEKERSLYKAIDAINDKQGDFHIMWGAYLKATKGSRVISPAWKPSGLRNIAVR
ncbi:MAG: hypothetical protein N3A62_07370 [Thermodesulfovibrionales bacterium]|nr:hypothetical protein [Thermodesulfovibrionales bacterium]